MRFTDSKNQLQISSYPSTSKLQITHNKAPTNTQKGQNMSSNSIYNIRIQRIKKNFVRKLKWNFQLLQPHILESPALKQSGKQLKFIKAISYPVKFQHFIIILNLAVNLILSILSSFQGFLLDYREETNNQASSIFMYFCFISYCIIFFVYCTNKNDSDFKTVSFITDSIYHYFFFQTMVLDILVISYCLINILGPTDIYIYSIIFFFVLIVSLYKNVRKIIKLETIYIKNEVQMLIWSLIKFSITNIIVAHIIGSLMLGMTLLNQQNNWMIKKEIAQQNWDVQYFHAFYWATTTMMTIGYGDITPVNITETIIISFIEMFSCVVLAFYISAIGGVISKLREREEDIIRKRTVFDTITKDEKGNEILSDDLKAQILEYLKQQEVFENCRQYKLQSEFLNELPSRLRQKYEAQRNKRLFKSVSFFKLLKSTSISNLSREFNSKFYYKEEKLLWGSKNRIMILERGQIGFTFLKKKSNLHGHIFDGVTSQNITTSKLLTPEFFSIFIKMNYQLKSKKSSILWQIDYHSFVDCLRQSTDFQFYFNNYYKHIIDENEWNEVDCGRCSTLQSKVYHSVYDCPRLVYISLKQTIIYKHIQSKYCFDCNRRSFKRMKRIKANVLKDFEVNRVQKLKRKGQSKQQNRYFRIFNEKKQKEIPKRVVQNLGLYGPTQRTIDNQWNINYQTFWPVELDIGQNYKNYFSKENPENFKGKVITGRQ